MKRDGYPTMTEQRRRQQRRQARRRVDDAREQACREAFRVLHEEGVIESEPEAIPTRAPNGLEQFAAEVPDDVLCLIRSGRLVQIIQEGRHAPAGVLERGWVCLDPDPPYESFPPDSAIASWEVTINS